MISAILILMKIRYQQTKNLDKSEDNNKKVIHKLRRQAS